MSTESNITAFIIGNESKSIGDLERSKSFSDNDLLLLSRLTKNVVEGSISEEDAEQQIDNYLRQSFIISSSNLLSDVCERFSRDFPYGSMAKSDPRLFSTLDHQHNYSNSYCSFDDFGDDQISVARIDIVNAQSKRSQYVKYPVVAHEGYKSEAQIGEIRYLARLSVQDCDVYSSDFNGWVTADGSYYKTADFPSAASVFGTIDDGTYFQVPTVNGMVMMNPGILKNDPMRSVKSSTHIPQHTHDDADPESFVDISVTYSSKIQLDVAKRTGSIKQNVLHGYYGSSIYQISGFSGYVDIYNKSTLSTQTSYEGENQTSFMPELTKLISRVYIGELGS